jgi:hypothetical protein
MLASKVHLKVGKNGIITRGFSMKTGIKTFFRRRFPETAYFAGTGCTMLAMGVPYRRESFAQVLCGDDTRLCRTARNTWASPENTCLRFAEQGGVAIIAGQVAQGLSQNFRSATLRVPITVGLSRNLPSSIEELRHSVRTSTTREDLRRIRKAGFFYRIETDPQVLSEFHENYAAALVDSRFPEDGWIESAESLVRKVEDGGELICVDAAGEWLAGILNRRGECTYALGRLGIRDGSEDVRRKHVTSALIVRSFERGVELGLRSAGLGASIPFLGKGPIWFKAKWGGVLSLDKSPRLHVLLDVRHESVREILSRNPVLHDEGGELAVAYWLASGPDALRKLHRDFKMFPGIRRWHILGEHGTIEQGADAFAAIDGVVPVAVPPAATQPLWVGDLLQDQDTRHGIRISEEGLLSG